MMWARVTEIILGGWLAISPFLFQPPSDTWWMWANEFLCASAVLILALLSFWPPLRSAHLLTIAVAFWLMAFGYFAAPHPLSPMQQNNLLVGLLFAMFAIVPTEATLPPQAWREFYASKEQSEQHEREIQSFKHK